MMNAIPPGKRGDGRIFAPELEVTLRTGDGDAAGRIILASPAVGWWHRAPATGARIRPGDVIGELEVLGVRHTLIAPPGSHGAICEIGPASGVRRTSGGTGGAGAARRPVAYGDPLLVLDPSLAASSDQLDAASAADPIAAEGTLVFRAPTSGRYYSRPGPDDPPFVVIGDEVTVGTTICLLEVMKTFNRVVYGGPGLPECARITRIVPRDEQDLAAEDPIVHLDPC